MEGEDERRRQERIETWTPKDRKGGTLLIDEEEKGSFLAAAGGEQDRTDRPAAAHAWVRIVP